MAHIDFGPSSHLSWKELACKDGTPYPSQFILDGRIFRLAAVFEDIRALYRKPITILSAYRTIAHNKKVGGAEHSQHLYGRALDLKPPTGISIEKFYNDIKRNSNYMGIHGLGKYATFVHIDIRPTSKLITWDGSNVKGQGVNT